jgi:predicted Zn-dependent protease
MRLQKIKLLFFVCSIIITPGTHSTIIESNVPDLGQRSHLSLSIETEAILGQAVMQQLRASDQLVQDLVVDEYLQGLSRKLSRALEKLDLHLDYQLKFFGFESSVLNAFAFLGGHIAVHTGLILALENEAELAAVLSHETAHIVQRHLARIVTDNKKMMPLTYAQLLGALLIGALGSPEAGSHIAQAAMGAHAQRLINYTREHEKEADRIGIQIMAKAGFDPKSFPEVFRILSQKTRFNEAPPEYLLTHPVHEARIADSTNRLKQLQYEPIPSDPLFFQLVRARIAVESHENVKQGLKRFKEMLDKHQNQDNEAYVYAYALSLGKNKQYEEAEKMILALEEKHPEVWVFPLSRAELNIESGHYDAAIAILKPLFDKHSRLHPIVVKYTEALLAANQTAAAEQILSKHRKSHPNDSQVLQQLVKSYSVLKRPVQLHQTQAAWLCSRGEFDAALKQLDFALDYTKAGSAQRRQIMAEKEKVLANKTQQKNTKV